MAEHDEGLRMHRRTFVTATGVALIGASGIAWKYGNEAAWNKLQSLGSKGVYDQDRWIWDENLPIRQPNSRGIEFADRAITEQSPYLTDETGMVIIQRPGSHVERFQDDSFASSYMQGLDALKRDNTPGVAIHFGDSYMQIMPPAYLQTPLEWEDLYGVSGMGPEQYAIAAKRRFSPDRKANSELLEYLKAHPSAPINLNWYITPHNDLEQMSIPHNASISASSVEPPSRREFLKKVGREILKPLGMDSPAKEEFLRVLINQTLGPVFTSNDKDFCPEVSDPRIQRLYNLLSSSAKTIFVDTGMSHPVNIQVVVNPSFYDDPSRKLPYTWDTIGEQFSKRFNEERSTPMMSINNLPVRELVHFYAKATGRIWNSFYNMFDSHPNGLGRSVAAEAIRWSRKQGALISDTVADFESQRQDLVQKHISFTSSLVNK